MCSSGHWDCLRNTLQRNVENQNILALFDVKKENIACDVGVKMLRYYLYNVKKDKCFREKVAKQVDWSQRFANEIYFICIHWYLKNAAISQYQDHELSLSIKVVLVETRKLQMKGTIHFSNNQCKIFHRDLALALFILETTLRFGRLRNDVTHKVVNVKAVEDDFKTIKSSKR